ncbi:hypothetical protein RRF57_011794 [Xylaria bambusicola]|uniref:Uncharacterized protein n=1 Tax=Xylaria bambusicola TaxID=326684 RepID=A0AAN7ZA87_9PEZI
MASMALTYVLVNYDFKLGPDQPKASSRLWTNTPNEKGTGLERKFGSHYSITGWESGPFFSI